MTGVLPPVVLCSRSHGSFDCFGPRSAAAASGGSAEAEATLPGVSVVLPGCCAWKDQSGHENSLDHAVAHKQGCLGGFALMTLFLLPQEGPSELHERLSAQLCYDTHGYASVKRAATTVLVKSSPVCSVFILAT
jgi:hypothetical protein